MLKAAIVLIAILAIGSALGQAQNPAGDTSKLKLVSEFEGGKLYRASSLNIVELHGSYKEMGRQYGALLKTELNEIYDNISADFGKKKGLSYQDLLTFERGIFELYPQRYKEIVYGMAETSGLGLDKQLIVNALESYLYLARHCSAIAVWGDYTSGGPLVFGRNYDWNPGLGEYVAVAVYNPDDGSIPVASVTYTGGVYVTTGMNKAGLFLETNGDVFENMYYANRPTTTISLFSFLENSATLEQLDAQIHSTNPSDGCLLNVADESQAYSYEWATFGLKRRDPDRAGLLVATNHFVDPYWGFTGPQIGVNDPIYTAERRSNLLSLAEKYRGNFTPEVMMKVISLPLQDGGAFGDPDLPTSYQIVAVPEERKIWVRIPNVSDWTQVDLKELFD
jgi:hypothetical protein